MTMVMTDVENTQRESWRENLEDFLEQACQAEAREDHEKANELLQQALHYDAKLHLDGKNAKAFTGTAAPAFRAKQAEVQ